MGKLFSPGKLLLTSEYVVLDGALALAVPTQFGQEFFFEEIDDGKSQINWNALHQNKFWLNAVIDYQSWEILETNLPESAHFVLKVLQNIFELNSEKFNDFKSYSIKTNLQFPPDFGLGSSSTLMNNLAQWANVDAFRLNDITLGGSGYDIAIAQEQSPILFQNFPEKIIEKIEFNPSFKNDLIFIHLNQKQNSRDGIQLYKSKEKSQKLIDEFSEITKNALKTENIEEFSYLMTIHEEKLSDFLQIETVKEKYFQNYGGFVKSLGAWGGDFVMASKFGDFQKYFSKHNFDVIFNWEDLII